MLTLFAVLEFILDFHSWPVHTNCPAHLLHVFVWLKRLQFYFGLITRFGIVFAKQKGIAFCFTMASSHNVHGDGVATDGAIGPCSGLFTEDTIDSQIPTINNDDNGMSNNVIDSHLTNVQASQAIWKSNSLHTFDCVCICLYSIPCQWHEAPPSPPNRFIDNQAPIPFAVAWDVRIA